MEGQLPTPPGPVIGGDWRAQLQDESRERIVGKILETLKRHVPFSGQEGLHELKKAALRFEEKTYAAATSKSDYLRKVSLKLLTVEAKSRNRMVNSLQSNAASNSINSQDPELKLFHFHRASLPLSSLNPPRHLQMDSNIWLQTALGHVQMPPGQVIGGDTSVGGCSEGGNGRPQLQRDLRERIVSNITETLKRNLPFSGQEGLHELKKIALRLEEEINIAATSELDYLTKISLKLSKMETKSENRMAHSLQSAAASNSITSQDPAPESMQP